MMRARTDSVCLAENASVENDAMAASHRSVGSQARIRMRSGGVTGVGMTDVAKCDCLFQSVVGRLARNDYVMDVAFAQSCSADADKPRLLLKLRNGAGPAVAHAGAQSTHKLVDHGGQRAPVRHSPFYALGNQFVEAIAVAVAIIHGDSDGRIIRSL